jgi:hypothetical protein
LGLCTQRGRGAVRGGARNGAERRRIWRSGVEEVKLSFWM